MKAELAYLVSLIMSGTSWTQDLCIPCDSNRTQTVDTGDPLAFRNQMRINVVHAQTIPPAAAGAENWAMLIFSLSVTVDGKLGNLKRSELTAISATTVLSEAYNLVIEYQQPASWSGVVLVPRHDWARRVLNPRTAQAICEV
jgi:hypothetical protein